MDYGLALRCDDGNLALRCLMPVIRMLLCLNSRRDSYCKSLLVDLMVLCYQRSINSPSWQMFLTNFSLFNEEVGEMSYSCLSRMTMHDTKRGDIDHISMLYCLIQEYAAVDDAVWSDHNRASMRNGSVKWKRDAPAGLASRRFMMGLVRLLSKDAYYVYPHRTQVSGSQYHEQYKSREMGSKYVVNANTIYMPAFWKADIRPDIEFHMRTIRNTMFGSYGHRVRMFWPQMNLVQDEHVNSPVRRLPNMEPVDDGVIVALDADENDYDNTERISIKDQARDIEQKQEGMILSDSDGEEDIRGRQLNELIGVHRTKARSMPLGSKVWTIDFAGDGNEVTLFEGIIQSRALTGGRRGQPRGIPTPSGYHRVLFTSTGMCEDIDGTNLDHKFDKAVIRLKKVKGTYRHQDENYADSLSVYEVVRQANITNNERMLAQILQ